MLPRKCRVIMFDPFDPEKVSMLLLTESNSSNAAIACYRMLIATESHVVSRARNLELHGSSRHPAWHGNGPPTVLVAAQIGALANSKLGCNNVKLLEKSGQFGVFTYLTIGWSQEFSILVSSSDPAVQLENQKLHPWLIPAYQYRV